ncbi:MazG nucleotide pyrophosphohydrolase domain protein [compost metagenome]
MEINVIQKWFEDFSRKEGWLEQDVYKDLGFLFEESGEVAREVRRHEIGRHTHAKDEVMTNEEMKEKLAEEIGDVLACLSVIASRYNITLQEAFNIHQRKMIKEYGDV